MQKPEGLAKIIIFLLIGIFCFAGLAEAKKHKKTEKEYQKEWCERRGCRTEVRMPDGTRCDCILSDYAIEFDFAEKWAEAFGQSIYYSMQDQTKRPGIVLILESEKDEINWLRLNSLIQYNGRPIMTWCIRNY
jgi:hypothetical protein